MNAHQPRRLGRNAAEILLRGGLANPAAESDPVAALLSAASAPAHDRELAGEAEAVAAFCAAHLRPITQPRRPSMSVTKLLVAKAALAALGLSSGGVALAAASGHLHAGARETSATGSAGASAGTVAASSAAKTPGSHPSPSPSPSMRGLCQAYTARGSNPGKALDTPAFAALIRTAGGRGNVSAYCRNLLASKPGHANEAHEHANPPGKSGDHPEGKPTSHP
jgi:hypothetical protein